VDFYHMWSPQGQDVNFLKMQYNIYLNILSSANFYNDN
jgi:hypothetical protein